MIITENSSKNIERNQLIRLFTVELMMLKFYLILLSAFSLFPRELIIAIIPELEKSINFYLFSVELSVGVFTIGSGISQLIVGGIGDLINKKSLLFMGAFLMIVGNILYYLSVNSFIFLLTRLIVGMGSGVFTVLIRVVVIEHFNRKQSLELLSWISMSTMIFPLIAPIIGIYVLSHYGLAWDYNLSVLGAVIMLVCVSKIPVYASLKQNYNLKNYFYSALCNIRESFIDRKMLTPMILSGMLFGCGIGHLTVVTSILHNQYAVALDQLGWYFIPVAVGYFLGSYSSSKFHYSPYRILYKRALFAIIYVLSLGILCFNHNTGHFESFVFLYFFLSGIYIPYLSQKSIAGAGKPAAQSSALGFIRTVFSFLYAIIASVFCSKLFSWLIMFVITITMIQYILNRYD